jgi:hypothetical protein
MTEYDFSSLSSYDFELLVRDLLQAELSIRFETFSRGVDQGIDFRHMDGSGATIVQCKHYGSYDQLLRALKNDEVGKVQKLKPKRYILAVSTALTPRRKDELLGLFLPFCHSTSDIYGRGDLNDLIGQHPEIERKHVKLWLTSEVVLQRVLNSGVWVESALTLEKIKLRASRYVPNPSYERAQELLNSNHYCIIAGIPGIGKTTLAEILLVDFVDRHKFEAIRVKKDLSEIGNVRNPKERQIFYFDDFLGETGLERLGKNEDQELVEFLEDVGRNPNWRFILTTREYILNTARLHSEVLSNPPTDFSPCVINLSDYTRPIRAKILYNHVYFSDLPVAYKRVIVSGKQYEKILGHKNYNPRIIDHMTQRKYVGAIPVSEYFAVFLENLTNPEKIWDHAFRRQLSEAGRHLLIVLASLPDQVTLRDLETSFDSFYQHRRKKLGFSVSSGDFEKGLRELDGNFIKISRVGGDDLVEFHNPSVNDFMENYLAKSPNEVRDLISGSEFFDQLVQLWKGCKGVRFRGIDLNSRDFFKALKRTFVFPTCSITVGERALGRKYDSPELRTLFIVECSQAITNVDGTSVIDYSISLITDRVKEGFGHKPDLVRLLSKLGPNLTKDEQNFFLAAKRYLIQELDHISDFDSLSDFLVKFPESLSENERDRAKVRFEGYCERYDIYEETDPDSIRALAEQIDAVSEVFDVDASDLRSELRQRAREIDNEISSRYEEDLPDDEAWQQPTPDDIGPMFDELLQRFNEISD